MNARQKEYDEQEIEKAYDEMLDETMDGQYLIDTYGAARILKEVDPIAYDCGMSDYEAELDIVWICDICEEEYDTEEEANECCSEEEQLTTKY